MPAFGTHLNFGQQAYKRMESINVKKAIAEHRKLFYLGLQGPDIFFFYPGSFLISKKNIGSIMHDNKTNYFFANMIKGIKNYDEADENILIAYIAGLMGHYFLDSTVHPYIYYFSGYYVGTKQYHNQHADLENEIDYLICKKYMHKTIYEVDYKRYVSISGLEAKVAGEKLSRACRQCFDVRMSEGEAYLALKTFKYAIGFFRDKYGLRRKLFRTGEKLFLGHEHFTPLIAQKEYDVHLDDILNEKHTEWHNPFNTDEVYIESFGELFDDAMNRYLDAVNLLGRCLDNQIELDELLKVIGNKSYRTGLNV